MAWIAGLLRELAHHRHADESLGEAGVSDRVFAELQRPDLVRVRVEVMSLDSTIVKVHPAGALEQTVPKPSGSHAGAGAPRFIGLPRMIEAQSDSRSPGEKRVTRHKDVPC